MPRHPDYTINELAAQMNISRDSIITLIGNGEITAYKVGNRWRIPYREYEIYTARHSNIKGYVYTLGDKVV